MYIFDEKQLLPMLWRWSPKSGWGDHYAPSLLSQWLDFTPRNHEQSRPLVSALNSSLQVAKPCNLECWSFNFDCIKYNKWLNCKYREPELQPLSRRLYLTSFISGNCSRYWDKYSRSDIVEEEAEWLSEHHHLHSDEVSTRENGGSMKNVRRTCSSTGSSHLLLQSFETIACRLHLGPTYWRL